MQTVYINGRFLTQRVTGIQRYSREMLLALDGVLDSRANSSLQFVVACPPGAPVVTLKNIKQVWVGRSSGHLWEQTSLLLASINGILLSFGSTGPLFHPKQVITVHDASIYRVPDAFGWKFKAWYKLCMNFLVRSNKLTLVVSNFAKRECAQFFGGCEEKMTVTSEGWQHLLKIRDESKTGLPEDLIGSKYYLAVSSPTPNKNFKLIGEAASLVKDREIHFVIAGAASQKVFSAAADSEDRTHRIDYLGYVSDADLLRLYEHAYAFVFPSRYEGFGIPPLEAMSMGCPVLAANIESVQEVCAESAVYFDPYDARTLKDALVSIDSDPELRNSMAIRGKARAAAFTWASAATKALDAIERTFC